MPKSRSDRWILALAVMWLAVQISPLWYSTPDSAAYISIARGIGQRHVLENHGRAQLYYSVGYPLLLSPLFAIDCEPFLQISLMQFGLGFGVIVLSYRWVSRIAPVHAAWVAALAVCTTSFGSIHRRPLTESAFTVSLIGGVLLLNRATAIRQMRSAVLGALVVAAATLIRPAGIMLGAGFGVVALQSAWRGETSWKQALGQSALVVFPALLLQLAAMLYDRHQATFDGGLCYADQIREPSQGVNGQLVEGIRLRIQEAGRLVIPGMYKSYAKPGDWLNLNLPIYSLLAVALIGGWLRLVRQCTDVFAWTLPFYVGLYIVWPFDQATRFFTPLTPLLLICLIMAAQSLRAETVRRIGFGVVAIHLAVAVGYWQFDERPTALALDADRANVERLSARIPIQRWKTVVVAEEAGPATVWVPHYLDRLVGIRECGASLPEKTTWLVTRADDPPPAGFMTDLVIGQYRLCRRDDLSLVRQP